MADLGSNALEGAAGDGDRAHEGGVTIALHDLGARLIGAKSECSQRHLLDLWADLAVGADRTRDLPRCSFSGSKRDALTRPGNLKGPVRHLGAHGGWLCVHAVRSPDHDRVTLLARAANDRGEQCCEACVNEGGGRAHLQCERGINDVTAGQTVVNPTPFSAHALRQLVYEGDNIVIGGALQLVDARDIHLRLGADYSNGVGGHFARCSLRVEHREFYLQRRAPARLIAPDRRHRRRGVTGDHRLAWRNGRQARSIVCVRSGPTERSTIGAPAISSSAVTYRRAFSGRSAIARTLVISCSQPGNVS